jgi:hypothetical protein
MNYVLIASQIQIAKTICYCRNIFIICRLVSYDRELYINYKSNSNSKNDLLSQKYHILNLKNYQYKKDDRFAQGHPHAFVICMFIIS